MQIRKIATEPLYHSICKVVNAPQPLTQGNRILIFGLESR
jgi:hypothetical protein